MLSDNIRKYRKANNLSQDELAEKLGITRQSVSLWETGQTQPSLDSIVALARIFHISTDVLLTDQDPVPSVESTDSTPAVPPKAKTPMSNIIGICLLVAAVLLVVAWLIIENLPKPENKGEMGTTVSTTLPEAPEDETGATTSTTAPEATEDEIDPSDSASEPTNPTSPSKPPETNVQNLYAYLKDFVIQNGTINGDYCYYSKSADTYGGYASEYFSLYYWGDTDKVEFCLHSVLDDTFSINFYLYVPQRFTGEYEYISSYYYRDTGEPLYEAKGTINASEFTENYPLNCSKYIGSTAQQNTFMEMSRQGVCDLLNCLREFTVVEKLAYSFTDLGFTNF